ncbi:MAG: hypothetical protein KGL53_14930, partial [Elusimicrobia bacterium]|nr:hypothetical protein [Elusimicrobiota bacterium]
MNDQTNGFDQTGRGTATPPEMDIPILRKKEKEKKGSGVVLPGAAGGAGQAVTGGALQSGGGFMALLTGKAGLLALALGVAGAGAVGVGVLRSRGAGQPAPGAPELSAPTDSLSVGQRNAYGSKSLAYLSKAAAGQVKWNDTAAASAK